MRAAKTILDEALTFQAKTSEQAIAVLARYQLEVLLDNRELLKKLLKQINYKKN